MRCEVVEVRAGGLGLREREAGVRDDVAVGCGFVRRV